MTTTDLIENVQQALEHMRPNHLWERLRTSEPGVAFSDVRDDLEHRVEETVARLLGGLPIVTQRDLERIEGEVASLRKKVDNLARQVRKSRSEN